MRYHVADGAIGVLCTRGATGRNLIALKLFLYLSALLLLLLLPLLLFLLLRRRKRCTIRKVESLSRISLPVRRRRL